MEISNKYFVVMKRVIIVRNSELINYVFRA